MRLYKGLTEMFFSQEYGLYAHPRYTSTWRNFNFSNIPLDELWEKITYNDDDFFVIYGLDKLKTSKYIIY